MLSRRKTCGRDLGLLLVRRLDAGRIAGHAEIGGLVGLAAAGDDGEKGDAEKAADGHSKHVTFYPCDQAPPPACKPFGTRFTGLFTTLGDGL